MAYAPESWEMVDAGATGADCGWLTGMRGLPSSDDVADGCA